MFFFVWALAPVCCCFAVSLLRRNANLAGGFAGRPCLSFFLVWSVYCHCHAFLYSLDIVFVLIRVVYVYPAFRTEPLSFIGRTWEKNCVSSASKTCLDYVWPVNVFMLSV